MITIHQCECTICQQSKSPPDQVLHRQMNLLMSRLDEQQRRSNVFWLLVIRHYLLYLSGFLKVKLLVISSLYVKSFSEPNAFQN